MNFAALDAAGEIHDWERPALCGWWYDEVEVEVEVDGDMARARSWVRRMVFMVDGERS